LSADDIAGSRQEQPAPSDTPDRQARALKVLVVVLGVLILIASAAVVAGMVYRAGRIGKGPAAGAMSLVPVGEVLTHRLALPEGSVVRSVQVSGNRIVVHYEGPRGAGLGVLDLATGQPIARVDMGPEGK
jgi:hypothetical protein